MNAPPSRPAGQGFSLIEVLVSLGLCALLATTTASAVAFAARSEESAGRDGDATLVVPALEAPRVVERPAGPADNPRRRGRRTLDSRGPRGGRGRGPGGITVQPRQHLFGDTIGVALGSIVGRADHHRPPDEGRRPPAAATGRAERECGRRGLGRDRGVGALNRFVCVFHALLR